MVMTGRRHNTDRAGGASPRSLAGVLALALGLTACVGCHHVRWPTWWEPGTIDAQRNQAVLEDPYPDTFAGPEVVGGRPRSYQKPLPEPDRIAPRRPAGFP